MPARGERMQRGNALGSHVLTCHFRHAGLCEGAPRMAPCSVVKTYRTCAWRCCGARCGDWLTGYVSSGNWSKSCLMGAGTEKKLLLVLVLLAAVETLLRPVRDMLAMRRGGGDDVAKKLAAAPAPARKAPRPSHAVIRPWLPTLVHCD